MREDRERGESRWGRLKAFAAVVAVAFAVTLAVVVGNRLSEEALGVLAGAVCGVGAAIPTSLIVVAVSRRQRDEGSSRQTGAREREMDYEPRHAYPPVVVVSPDRGQFQSQRWGGSGGGHLDYRPASPSPRKERRFTVVGGTPVGEEEPW